MADREKILEMWIARWGTRVSDVLTPGRRDEILGLPEMDALEQMRSDDVREAISREQQWDLILRKAQSIEKKHGRRAATRRSKLGVPRPPVKPDPQGGWVSPLRDPGGHSDDDPVVVRTRPSER